MTHTTEALHYFIGHDDYFSYTTARYLAAIAAHITHMLRDTCNDVAAGYFNIPYEFVRSNRIAPGDVDCFARQLAQCKHLRLGGVFTHFASSGIFSPAIHGEQTEEQEHEESRYFPSLHNDVLLLFIWYWQRSAAIRYERGQDPEDICAIG